MKRSTRQKTSATRLRAPRIARGAAFVVVAAMLVFACGGGEEPAAPKSPASAPKPPPPTAPSPPPTPAPPPAAVPAPAPVDLSAGDAAAGKALYVQNCATCHGAGGAGDGVLAASLNPKPAAHTDGNYMNGLDNAHLYKVIKEGGPSVGKSALMAPWGGTLSDQEIVHVIAFIRTLADPPYPGS